MACGDDCCNSNSSCQSCNRGNFTTNGVNMPGGVGYDDAGGPSMVTDQGQSMNGSLGMPNEMSSPSAQPMPPSTPDDLPLPSGLTPADGATTPPPSSGALNSYGTKPNYAAQSMVPAGEPQYSASRPYSIPRQPVYMRNSSKPNNPQPSASGRPAAGSESGLIGPVGYDAQ